MFAAFNETSYDSDFKFIKTQHPPKFHYFVSFVVNSQNKLIPRCYPHSLRVFPHRILDFERSALGFGPTGEYKPSEKRKSCPKGTRNKTKAASSRKREEDDSESESENSDLEEQEKSVSRPATTLNYVKTHSLYFPVDRLELWLSWPAWTWLLHDRLVYMHVETDSSWFDERTDFMNNVAGTIMINQQSCSYMVEHVVRKMMK